MSRWSSSRAQTEPIAAIVAVSILVIGLGLYAVSVQTVLPGTSQQTTADRTIDRIWSDIEQDGVFHTHDAAADFEENVTAESLPTGATVAVEVTAVHENERQTVASGAFPKGFPTETAPAEVATLETYLEAEGPPDDASVATMSIPITVENSANVRSGTLRVAVW